MTDALIDGNTTAEEKEWVPDAGSSSSEKVQVAVDPPPAARRSDTTVESEFADLLTAVNGSSWTRVLARNHLALRLRPLIDNGYDWSDPESEAIFARELRSIISRTDAIDVLEAMVSGAMTSVKGAADTLIELGALVETQTREARRTYLERCLGNRYGMLRDAAALGLAHLADERSLAPLERAADNEADEGIKKALAGSLRDLRLAFDDASSA